MCVRLGSYKCYPKPLLSFFFFPFSSSSSSSSSSSRSGRAMENSNNSEWVHYLERHLSPVHGLEWRDIG